MSDIYLQITETPTVVTLSAPVVSGALSSTVTVANTVTVSLDSNSLSALENVTVTVGAAITGTVTVSNFPATQAVSLSSVPTHGVTLASTTVTVSSLPAISGTVTANTNINSQFYGESTNKYAIRSSAAYIDGGDLYDVTDSNPLPVCINDSSGNSYGTSGNPLKVSGTVTIGAGTAQIGSVTASISGTVPISISSVTVGNSVTIGSLPALVAGTAQIGSVTASISNTVVTFYPMQGTTVTNSNFTSTTASTTLVSAVAGRDVLTVFNEGAGNLHISPGATCTTVAYQVRLSAGDYWECPAGQLSLAYTAVYATAGTARVTQIS